MVHKLYYGIDTVRAYMEIRGIIFAACCQMAWFSRVSRVITVTTRVSVSIRVRFGFSLFTVSLTNH